MEKTLKNNRITEVLYRISFGIFGAMFIYFLLKLLFFKEYTGGIGALLESVTLLIFCAILFVCRYGKNATDVLAFILTFYCNGHFSDTRLDYLSERKTRGSECRSVEDQDLT